jgi:hypothetical protein
MVAQRVALRHSLRRRERRCRAATRERAFASKVQSLDSAFAQIFLRPLVGSTRQCDVGAQTSHCGWAGTSQRQLDSTASSIRRRRLCRQGPRFVTINLLDRDRFRQAPRAIDVATAQHGAVILKQLQRRGVKDRREGRMSERQPSSVYVPIFLAG